MWIKLYMEGWYFWKHYDWNLFWSMFGKYYHIL